MSACECGRLPPGTTSVVLTDGVPLIAATTAILMLVVILVHELRIGATIVPSIHPAGRSVSRQRMTTKSRVAGSTDGSYVTAVIWVPIAVIGKVFDTTAATVDSKPGIPDVIASCHPLAARVTEKMVSAARGAAIDLMGRRRERAADRADSCACECGGSH